MKIVLDGCYKYIPTKDIEVSQNKRVYKCFLFDEFIGYRVKMPSKTLINGREKRRGYQFKQCKKVYEDINGGLKFIIC